MNNEALNSQQRDLILANRGAALKIARSLLKRWNMRLEICEVQSLADMALCDASRTFDSKRGTQFTTYLFLFIKGALIGEIKRGLADPNQTRQTRSPGTTHQKVVPSEKRDGNATCDYQNFTDNSPSPEELSYRKELRSICQRALKTLQPLERETMIGVDIMGHKVAQFARQIGYSRPYVSAVRSKALVKLQPFFEQDAA